MYLILGLRKAKIAVVVFTDSNICANFFSFYPRLGELITNTAPLLTKFVSVTLAADLLAMGLYHFPALVRLP